MPSNNRPKCQGSMSQGFVVDVNQHSQRTVSTWVTGAPEKGWFGVKVGRKPTFQIQTWRCGRCGFLESYAKG